MAYLTSEIRGCPLEGPCGLDHPSGGNQLWSEGDKDTVLVPPHQRRRRHRSLDWPYLRGPQPRKDRVWK